MITFNPSADFSLFDNVEDVTFTHRNTAGQTVTIDNGVKALRHLTTVDLDAAASELVIETGKWHLLASTLSSKPKADDYLVSALYGQWLVLDVESTVFNTRWVVTCQKL